MRCRDSKCKGTLKYILDTGETIVNKECTIINYYDHNYAKKAYISKKIEKNEIEEEDIDNGEYQAHFLIICILFTLIYYIMIFY